MVNIWLTMIYNDLVGGFEQPTPLKNDGLKVSWGPMNFPTVSGSGHHQSVRI
jgi:hypothetical protein